MTSHRPTLIVTGVSRGIGRSIAIFAIQKFDANVIGVARSKEGLQKLSQHIENDLNLKDRFKFVAGDVTDESTSQEAVALALKSWSGKLNGLVLNAGTFDVNLFSILTTLQHALPALRESKGRVIIVSSDVAHLALHGWGAYCSTKAALKMFSDVFAMEEPELTTVSIRPGVVDTDMTATVRKEGVEKMTPNQYAMFSSEKTERSLPYLHPDVPGHVIASLAISAPASLNGKSHSWNDEELKTHRN
ncbi:hypothetical protein BGZ99_000260 [Dissophora globulifera]|uniref:NAD(P)-binding protein n=1 Tax=Dissophora globulifera TaxID=979702 RepID=A0A9P6ULS8_9FUNG|nr:hypothetical protein BGZ99_000260 [Dissophora globulifera]